MMRHNYCHYLTGSDAVQLQASFVDVINGKIFAKLHPFVPTNECVTASAGIKLFFNTILAWRPLFWDLGKQCRPRSDDTKSGV